MAKQIQSDRMTATLSRVINVHLSKHPDRTPMLTSAELKNAFPGSSPNAIRKRFAKFGSYNRDGGALNMRILLRDGVVNEGKWMITSRKYLKTDEQIAAILTPETVVLHEAMLYGEYRLKRFGLRSLHVLHPNMSRAVNMFEEGHRCAHSVSSIPLTRTACVPPLA